MTLRLRTLALASVLLLTLSLGALAENFTFVHISDIHITGSGNCVKNLTAIADELNAMQPKPAFVLVTGDETETGLTRDWERFSETITKFSMPLYCTPGNHETKWSHWGKFGLHKFLNRDARYSFTHGGVHFVAMDSTVWLQHHGLIDKSQLAWLRSDLEKAGRDTPAVLFYHHCPGFIPNQPELLRTIRPYNVRLILVGHGHVYKTWKYNGLLFQEVRGAKNEDGAYRILEVTDGQIKSFTKLVGSAPMADGIIPLARTINPVDLTLPRPDSSIDGALKISAKVSGKADGRTVQYSIDDDSQPLTADANGSYSASVDFQGTPGWHTVVVTAQDADGMQWTDSTQVRLNGASREAWRVKVSGGIQRGVRAVGDRLYFANLAGDAYCLDARTGREIWRYSAGSEIVGEVAVEGPLACFGTTDGRIIGLDAKSGKEKWHYATGGPILGSAAIADGKVLIDSGEPAFYSLDAKTGKFISKFAMDRASQVAPLVLDGGVLFGAWDKNFYKVDAKTNTVLWKTPIGVSFYYSTANSDPATDGQRVVCNVTPYKPEDADIYCIDQKTGAVLWSRRNPGKSDCGFNSPCVDGDRCYSVAGNGEVFCMSMKDGSDIWRATVGMSVVSGKPAVVNGKIYVACLCGTVACLDTKTSRVEWKYSTGDGYLFGGETVWKDLLIVPSTDGTVTALKL